MKDALPALIPAPCAEKGRLLKEWSQTAAVVSELTRLLAKERGLIPKEDSQFISKKLEIGWKACENARKAFQRHQCEHGC